MSKELHAVEFNGMTFGMPIDGATSAWRKFKKAVKRETCINRFGKSENRLTVDYQSLASIMESAGWIVSEQRSFECIHISDFNDNAKIYVKYTDEPIDFRKPIKERQGLNESEE